MASSQKSAAIGTDDINIVLLGATGVGKTTFINAFASYLAYNSLEEAINGPLQAIIPACFTFTDKETFEEKTIVIGTPNDSEIQSDVGESCTKQCRSFVFRIGNRNLRLIDTPGIGDTQGILEDIKNFENIMAHIAQYEYLNGLCILLKSSDERTTIMFRFCVKELLRHLHVHAKQNILFVLTNARATQFNPGPVTPILRRLLDNVKDRSNVEIPFNKGNTFLFDNEAFRFLALLKNGIECSASEIQDYSKSWKNTIEEFSRLIERVSQCEKLETSETLSLNEAQILIRRLARPVAEISRLIQENIQLAEQHKNDIFTNRTSTPGILSQTDAKVVPLGHPRTVCTNKKCIKIITVNGQPNVEYASHCHPHCLLTDVRQEAIGHESLKNCDAMDKKSYTCEKCGCSWKQHMHITYEFRKLSIKINMNKRNDTRSTLLAIEKWIEDLKNEQKQIKEVYIRVSKFLRTNSLNPVNNDILEYTDLFIQEEKGKNKNGPHKDMVIEALQNFREDFALEIASFDQQRETNQTPLVDDLYDLTVTDELMNIFVLVNSLFQLPINGGQIRAQVDEVKRLEQEFTLDREQVVDLPQSVSSSHVMEELERILSIKTETATGPLASNNSLLDFFTEEN